MINDRLNLGTYLNDLNQLNGIVEVGVLFGEFSEVLLKTYNGKVFMVDPWINQSPNDYLDGCNSVNMHAASIRVLKMAQKYPMKAYPLKMFSHEALQSFSDGSLSCVYIDGNHAYDWVVKDLENWWPKVRPGGIFGGHDFYEAHTPFHECGVETAVKEFSDKIGLPFTTSQCTSWWITKL